MIGLASQMDGLYKFHASSFNFATFLSSQANKSCNFSSSVSCNSSSVIPNKSIWHFRLGHLSH